MNLRCDNMAVSERACTENKFVMCIDVDIFNFYFLFNMCVYTYPQNPRLYIRDLFLCKATFSVYNKGYLSSHAYAYISVNINI